MSAISKIITLLLFSIYLTACTSSLSSLASGDDEDGDIGLGGTGLLASQLSGDNGLGGTGILGQITGFGSIFVNGIEVEYNATTPFSINGKTAKYQPLHIGDIVEILTEDSKDHTQAVAINLRHEVIGLVKSTDPATYSFMINNQKIIQPINSLPLPQVGERVAVAGFRINENTVMSTRITKATTANLLRSATGLPFKDKSNQWLIQLHVEGNLQFKLNNSTHTINTDKVNIDKANQTAKKPINIKILKLMQSSSRQLILNETISPTDIPLGRPTLEPVEWNHQKKAPAQSPWSNPRQWQNNGHNPGPHMLPGVGAGTVTGTQQNRNK